MFVRVKSNEHFLLFRITDAMISGHCFILNLTSNLIWILNLRRKKTRQMLHSIRKPTLTLFCLSEAEKSFHLVGVNPHTSIVVFAVVVGPCNFRLLLILNCLNNLWGVVFFIIILFFIFMFNEDKRCTTDTLRWSTTSFQNPTHRRQMLIV